MVGYGWPGDEVHWNGVSCYGGGCRFGIVVASCGGPATRCIGTGSRVMWAVTGWISWWYAGEARRRGVLERELVLCGLMVHVGPI